MPYVSMPIPIFTLNFYQLAKWKNIWLVLTEVTISNALSEDAGGAESELA